MFEYLYLLIIMSSRPDADLRIRAYRSMVKSVLALLNTDVSVLINAENMTARRSPLTPEIRNRELYYQTAGLSYIQFFFNNWLLNHFVRTIHVYISSLHNESRIDTWYWNYIAILRYFQWMGRREILHASIKTIWLLWEISWCVSLAVLDT